MSGSKRTLIRHVIADAIDSELQNQNINGWVVSHSRKNDFREESRIISVFLGDGSLSSSQGSDKKSVNVALFIQISTASGDDDSLDVVADSCEKAVTDTDLTGVVSGIVPTGFDYPLDNESAYNDFQLSYKIIYSY